jgi:hypothetical protein
VVGRLPLCLPNTYSFNLSYAGKEATVVSFKRNKTLDIVAVNMSHLPENLRVMMNDLKNGGVLSFRFVDGTILENCGNIGLIALSSNLTLASGEIVSSTTPAQTGHDLNILPSSGSAHPQQCPMTITEASSGLSFGHSLVDAMITSEFERQLDQTIHGGAEKKHYLDIRVRNDTKTPVRAFEFAAIYVNRMGNQTTSAIYISQNTQPIKA